MKNRLHFLLAIMFFFIVSCSSQRNKVDRAAITDIREHPLPEPDADILTPTAVEGDDKLVNYTVQRGDTLFSISRAHGMTVQELQTINNLSSTNIHVGQSLLVRATTSYNHTRESIIHDLPAR